MTPIRMLLTTSLAALGLSACDTLPDLTPVDVAGARIPAGTDTRVAVSYGVRNRGTAPLPSGGPAPIARYYLETADGSRRYALSEASIPPLGAPPTSLPPGETSWHSDTLIAGPNSAPDAALTRVCVTVDAEDAVREFDETNNVVCGPFPVAAKPDLIVEGVRIVGLNLDTVEMDIAYANVGLAPTGSNFRLGVETPDLVRPLGYSLCAAPRRLSDTAPCPSPSVPRGLDAGQRGIGKGYLLIPRGASAGSGSLLRLVVIADHCAPGTPPRPACEIDELREDNNASVLLEYRIP